MSGKKFAEIINKYKYPLIVLLVGLILIMLPSGIGGKNDECGQLTEDEARLQRVLEGCEGVGSAGVLISDSGVVIVCDGAGDVQVRYAVTMAAQAFTGFTGDRIQILNSAQISGGKR